METYFLCDPLSLLPGVDGRPGPAALKLLVEVPNYSNVMEPLVKVTVLEAVQFKFGNDTYRRCSNAGPIPIQKRTDVREPLPREDWMARGGSRVWFVNDSEDHSKYFNEP
jgi:hypothetical protein